MNLKELIKENSAHFDSYRAGNFYYKIFHATKEQKESDCFSGTWYQFTIPLEDINGATLPAKDKAIFFMKWIRKGIADKTFVKL